MRLIAALVHFHVGPRSEHDLAGLAVAELVVCQPLVRAPLTLEAPRLAGHGRAVSECGLVVDVGAFGATRP
jgi:hypothetical protein